MKNQIVISTETESNIHQVNSQIQTLDNDLVKWFKSLPMSLIARFGNSRFDVNMPFAEINDRMNFCIEKFKTLPLEHKMQNFVWLNDLLLNGE